MFHIHVWRGLYLLVVPAVGFLIHRLDHRKANVHRDGESEDVIALAKGPLLGVSLVWQGSHVVISAIMLFVLQSPTLTFADRQKTMVVFVDDEFVREDYTRTIISRGLNEIVKRYPGMHVAIMTNRPWLSFHWLSPEEGVQELSPNLPMRPISSLPGAQLLPTVTEAALVLMSAWRTKRYLLAIVGDEITPNELGIEPRPHSTCTSRA